MYYNVQGKNNNRFNILFIYPVNELNTTIIILQLSKISK